MYKIIIVLHVMRTFSTRHVDGLILLTSIHLPLIPLGSKSANYLGFFYLESYQAGLLNVGGYTQVSFCVWINARRSIWIWSLPPSVKSYLIYTVSNMSLSCSIYTIVSYHSESMTWFLSLLFLFYLAPYFYLVINGVGT
jgi:hypothetical protein